MQAADDTRLSDEHLLEMAKQVASKLLSVPIEVSSQQDILSMLRDLPYKEWKAYAAKRHVTCLQEWARKESFLFREFQVERRTHTLKSFVAHVHELQLKKLADDAHRVMDMHTRAEAILSYLDAYYLFNSLSKLDDFLQYSIF